MAVILEPLQKALASLGRALVRAQSEPADEELRDATIQRFEYTYELCWKLLKRRLEEVHPSSTAVDQMSFPDLLREGASRGMLDAVEPWLEYRRQRNLTSHSYDADVASKIFACIPAFAKDAEGLLGRLEPRSP